MYTSNISIIVGDFRGKLEQLKQNPDAMLRTVALTVLPAYRKRIHVDGKDSSEQQIGIYSPEYMKVRTGNFVNSDRNKKGKNKGQVKNSGTFSRGLREGQARPKYNRTADTKVIASLTRQMENDESVQATEDGYGIGFINPFNYQKSQWVTKTYKKAIFDLTETEAQLAQKTAQDYVDDFLKN